MQSPFAQEVLLCKRLSKMRYTPLCCSLKGVERPQSGHQSSLP